MSFVFRYLLGICTLAAFVFLGVPAPVSAAPLEVSAVSDAVRVFEDGLGFPEQPAGEICVFALRGEIVSGQCAIRAGEDLQAVTVSVSPLECCDAKATLPAECLTWNFVESIFIEKNTPKLVKTDLVRSAPARFPDCLGDQRECAIAKGALKAVYLTIRVPRDAKPGEYRGQVTVKSNAGSAAVPLVLTVYPLTIPEKRHVMVSEWLSTHQFAKWHNINSADSDEFFRMLRLYADNMVEHRQNVFRVSIDLIGSTRGTDGKLRFDFAKFDRWAEVFWSTGHMDRLETGFVAHFGEGGWSSLEVKLRDFSVKDEATGKSQRLPGKEFLPQFLPALVGHLREKGWLDKTVFHICDEPSNHNVMAWREASDFIHQHAPELRRIDAIETPHCLDRLEVWVPKLDSLAMWQTAYEEAQRRGNELWFYTVGIFQHGSLPNKTLDMPLIDSRLMHWLNYRYGTTGYLHWGFNAWTDDPINAPGKHRGDGWHVYPKKDGLLNSLRWEQMRGGLQDYECLWLLENAIGELKGGLAPRVAELIEPRRRGVEIASQVVPSYQDCRRDPEVLYAARRQAIEETLALKVSPRAILQTTPLEHSSVDNNGSIDVHGWAEPGSTVTVNGQVVPVAADGLFIEQLSPSKEGTIRVVIANNQGQKTFVRKFHLRY